MDARRKALLEKRRTLSQALRTSYSEQIQKKLRMYLQEGKCIAWYMATVDEVQLQPLLDEYKTICTCVLPRCRTHGEMDFYQIDLDTKYQQSNYGIWEPISSDIVDSHQIDIIIVPIVGFDEQCHRIGHGAGYYDRYLANTKALKIGVAFEIQKLDEIVPSQYDIDMDLILTQTTIYTKN